MTARPGVYSVEELVEVFAGHRCRSALYEDVRRGLIPSVRLGRRVFIPGWYVERLRNGDQPVSSEPPTSTNEAGTRRGT